MFKVVILVALLFNFSFAFTIASGAGYKKPILEICKLYESESGKKVDTTFGNMRQILTQAKNSYQVAIVVGDKKFLEKSNLKFSKYKFLGLGKLVLAYPKGKKLGNLSDLLNENIKRVATPHPKKAIYGKASTETISNVKLKIEDKLLTLATVPQVSSYIISNEIDAGFINLTNAIAVRDKIGGFFKVEQNLYQRIEIVSGILNSSDEVEKFLKFLDRDRVKKIFNKYGLEAL